MTKSYSQLAIAVDLVSYEYKTSNPIIIAEMIERDLGLEYSIHHIADYMCINKLENGDVQVDYTYNCDYKMQRVYSPNAEIKVFRN